MFFISSPYFEFVIFISSLLSDVRLTEFISFIIFSFIVIVFVVLLSHIQVLGQDAKNKVIETIQVFPYQHPAEADAALAGMSAWDKKEWN